MKLIEIAAGGVWAASVVSVAGFTFEAFSQTKDQVSFGPGGSGGGLPGPGQNIPSSTKPFYKKKTDALGNTGGVPTGKNVKAPPAYLIQALLVAVNNNNKQSAQMRWKEVLNWANSRQQKRLGWDTKSVTDWAYTQPWFGKFSGLTGTVQIQG